MTMMSLRPYQEEARRAIHAEWEGGHRRTMAVLPTGTGKTVLFSAIVQDQTDQGGNALILAHRGELQEQAADKLRQVTGLEAALEKAESSALGSPLRVTVGSIQSLAQPRRLGMFPQDYYTDIIVDEAHHVLSESYRRVLDHFSEARVLGVTATPDRGDRRDLGQYFDSEAYSYSMRDAIRDGYLAPIVAQMVPVKVDLCDVSLSNGDYAAGDLGEALEPYLVKIAEEMTRSCADRKTVVFLPLVSTSRKFRDILNRMGMRACEVNGDSADRKEILQDFRDGKYNVICNAMLLTEGWDQPDVDCVVILRPTRVRGLFQQMVGRGMRLAPGKKNLLLLDFLWLTSRHDLCRPSCLVSKDQDIAKKVDGRLEGAFVPFDLMEAEEEAERDVAADREKALARELEKRRSMPRRLVDPLQYAVSIAAEDLMDYTPSFAWEMGPASPNQLAYLVKHGISGEFVQNAGMASLLISRIQQRREAGLSTPKQIRFLEQKGFRHVGMWSFEAASRMIGAISENAWAVPPGIQPEIWAP